MTKTAINKESGIETTEINVVRIFRRNSIIITIAKIAPKIALLSIVSTDFSIGAPWSNVEMISKSLYFSQDLYFIFYCIYNINCICIRGLHNLNSIASFPFVREIDSAFPTSLMSAISSNVTVGIRS